MRCPSNAAVALAALLGTLAPDSARAHAGLQWTDPIDGATLGESPAGVQLSLTEQPETALSVIRVLDTGGASYQIGRPERVSGDPRAVGVRVRPLDTGVYTVSWRVVSAVDGHATSGAYAFGVRMTPTAAAASRITTQAVSALEMPARWFFIAGLVVLLGAAAAGVAHFGGRRDLALGTVGWGLAALGLILLADAQRRNAGAAFADLIGTAVGRALLWRALALGAAGAALFLARWGPTRMRERALAALALAVLAAMAAHVAAGHAAAGGWPGFATVLAQWAHFAAAGVWLGGAGALLLGVRGAPSAEKAAAVRRFSNIAGVGLFIVVATGLVRAVNEISSWAELVSTAYGWGVLAKLLLFVAIAALGAFNRWWSVPAALTTLRPLRRAAGTELVLAAGVLAVAAMLGALPTPAAQRQAAVPDIDVTGSDFATSVRVRLTTASDQPGPNRFVVRAVDYDSNAPVHAKRVRLRFTPLDDPGVPPTSLTLAPGPDGSYRGAGANLAFDGRWRVSVLIERAGDAVEVPLEVAARGTQPFLSVERIPGRAPSYTLYVRAGEAVRISPDPQHAGRSRITITCFDRFGDRGRIDQMVVTSAAGAGPAHQQRVERLEQGRFVADVELRPGRNTIAAIARAVDGRRVRAAVDLDVP